MPWNPQLHPDYRLMPRLNKYKRSLQETLLSHLFGKKQEVRECYYSPDNAAIKLLRGTLCKEPNILYPSILETFQKDAQAIYPLNQGNMPPIVQVARLRSPTSAPFVSVS